MRRPFSNPFVKVFSLEGGPLVEIFKNRALSYYFSFCLGAAAILVVGLLTHFEFESLPLLFPFTCSFVTISIYFAISSRPWQSQVVLSQDLISFFLFQYCLLLGMCFEFQLNELVLMASLPIVSALYAINSHSFLSTDEKRVKAYGVIFIVFCSLPIPLISLNLLMEPKLDLSWVYTSFFLWQLGLFFLASIDERKESSSLKERYFFHDAINHTHGLILFLKGRLLKNKGLGVKEVEDVLGEIHSWQSLLQNHFEMGHKNLIRNSDHGLDELLAQMKRQAHFFKTSYNIEIFINYGGDLQTEGGTSLLKKLHFPKSPLLRIYTNLLKNAVEANSHRIEVIHSLDKNHYSLVVKNELNQAPRKNYELGKILGGRIANGQNAGAMVASTGLEAIDSLSRSLGGTFEFQIQDGVWISQVLLPHFHSFNYEGNEGEKAA